MRSQTDLAPLLGLRVGMRIVHAAEPGSINAKRERVRALNTTGAMLTELADRFP